MSSFKNFFNLYLEAVKLPIRDEKKFFKFVKRRYNFIKESWEKIKDFREHHKEDFQDYVDEIKHSTGDIDNLFYYLDVLLEKNGSLERAMDTWNWINQLPGRYVSLKHPYLKENLENIFNRYFGNLGDGVIRYSYDNRVEEILNHIKRGFRVDQYEEYEETKNCFKKLGLLLEHVQEFMVKIRDWVNRSNIDYEWNKREEDHRYRDSKRYPIEPPDMESVEIAYHASISAKKIYENGFDPISKTKGGIGGANVKNGISFTFDLYHAKEIARCLKICWMIANDKMKWPALYRYMKDSPYSEGYDIESVMDGFHRSWGKDKHPSESKETMLRIFSKFLWLSEMYNPVFFGIDYKDFIEILQTVFYSDIGVLKCEINTEKGEFIPSMAEIRITPENVREILSFIS